MLVVVVVVVVVAGRDGRFGYLDSIYIYIYVCIWICVYVAKASFLFLSTQKFNANASVI